MWFARDTLLCVTVYEQLARKYESLAPLLDERQRRRWMGVEARALGRGGVSAVARATGASRSTVTAAVKELAEPESAAPAGRVRRAGAGRPAVTDTDPRLVTALEELVDPATRGDPESPLRWTSKSTPTLAAELFRRGHRVGERTVAKLLHEAGYSLQAARKTREGGTHPDRDAQFRYLSGQVAEHLAAGQPVVSVDTKKKELVGTYKNAGREWQPKGRPEQVNVYDFVGEAGKAIPYGVYDVAANAAWVSVGHDHDTAAFAVATLRRWWAAMGRPLYPQADRLLICADGGGSNGSRVRLWKVELAAFAADTRLEITVLPPTTRNVEVEQNRAPAVLPHLDELARPAPGKPRNRRPTHRRHDDPHRAHDPGRTRRRRLPGRHQDQQ